MYPDQFSFRKGHFAPHYVHWFVEHFTTAVFLDIEKVFDRVWIYALIYKLIKCNFPLVLIKFIFPNLFDRDILVRVKGKLSRNLLLFRYPPRLPFFWKFIQSFYQRYTKSTLYPSCQIYIRHLCFHHPPKTGILIFYP